MYHHTQAPRPHARIAMGDGFIGEWISNKEFFLVSTRLKCGAEPAMSFRVAVEDDDAALHAKLARAVNHLSALRAV